MLCIWCIYICVCGVCCFFTVNTLSFIYIIVVCKSRSLHISWATLLVFPRTSYYWPPNSHPGSFIHISVYVCYPRSRGQSWNGSFGCMSHIEPDSTIPDMQSGVGSAWRPSNSISDAIYVCEGTMWACIYVYVQICLSLTIFSLILQLKNLNFESGRMVTKIIERRLRVAPHNGLSYIHAPNVVRILNDNNCWDCGILLTVPLQSY